MSFATDLTANFSCNQFRIMQTLLSSFYVMPSAVVVLFNSNLSILSILGQVFDLDLVHCTGFDLEYVPMSYFFSDTNEWLKK